MKSNYFTAIVILSAVLARESETLAVTTLNFDDIPAKDSNAFSDVIREEYAHLGVHFNHDGRHGGIVREGISNGDPGNWDLEGTNGPNFLGHNSFGRSGLIEFGVPVSSFSVDAALGSGPLDHLYFFAERVGTVAVSSGPRSSPKGVWTTISFSYSAGITSIDYFSTGDFGLDNIRFTPIPEPAATSVLFVALCAALSCRRR